MKLLITGASGFIGKELVLNCLREGHNVKTLVRRKPKTSAEIFWDPDAGKINANELEGFDAVVHLAGESIASGRWTSAKKRRILESRVRGTRLLSETLSKLSSRPRVFVSASAVGYYGSRGDEVLTENSSSGTDFLSEVCRQWESSAMLAQKVGIRTVFLRFGVVLSTKGGALPKMLLPFRLGFGGRIGNGRQYLSWTSLDDAVGAILHTIRTEKLQGPVNVVAPEAVTNQVFTKTLGRVLYRPTLFPLPAFAARVVMGEMADALLLSSARVEPAKLKENGYRFQHPTLKEALSAIL